MKRNLSLMVVGLLMVSLMASITLSTPIEEKPTLADVFNTVYCTPRHPVGHEWEVGDGGSYNPGWGGDAITVYADVDLSAQSNLYIKYAFCSESACYPGEPGPPDDMDFRNTTYVLGWHMNHIGGTLYSKELIGDWDRGVPSYAASTHAGIHVEYWVYSKNATTGAVVLGAYEKHYTYWPPSSINATTTVSKSSLSPGETMWVNGTANYWHRLNWHGNPPADESDVTISINPDYYGKSDIYGNYSFELQAPSTPGAYMVNTTLTNATYNRNATSVCLDVQIEVMSLANYSISVQAGWNLISVPFDMISGAMPDALLDTDVDTVWDVVQYCEYSGQWKTFSVHQPTSLITLSNVDDTMGLWMHVADPGDGLLKLEGVEPSLTLIPLYTGWNLVGYPTLNGTVTVANALWGTSADCIMVCDPAEPYHIREVGSTYVMQPGEGYWIHVPIDTTWVIDW